MTHLSHDSYVQKRDAIAFKAVSAFATKDEVEILYANRTGDEDIKQAAKAIDDLFLEVIGQDEARNVSMRPDGKSKFDLSVPRNYLKADQRALVRGEEKK